MTRDAVKGSGFSDTICDRYFTIKQGNVPRGKKASAELRPVTEISSIRKDSFSVRLRVEAE